MSSEKTVESLQHFRDVALDDALGEALGDGGLADARIADEKRIVLLPAAKHLDGAADLGIAADQRVDLALLGLVVEVDAIGFERVGLLLRVLAAFDRRGIVVDAAHRTDFGHAGALGDAVADVVDRVVACHVLLLQEIGRVALALGEDRDEHVGAGHFLAAGRLDVDHRALDDALETSGRLRILFRPGGQIGEFGVDIFDQVPAQHVEVDVAGAHDRGSVLIIEKGEQEML